MPEVICDVSPIQYLHQVGLLDLLRLRYGAITIPPAVSAELREGTLRRVDLPAFEALGWMKIRQPAGRLLLPIVADLGAGEREVLALGTETLDSLVILDDALARQYARMLNLKLTGTLGVLLKAKEAVKAKLKGFGASELMTLVRDLYHASPENRQFLRGRLLQQSR